MQNNDIPKIWVDEDEDQPTELIEIQEIPQVPVPTPEEQAKIVTATDLSQRNQEILQSVVEMNKVAETLKQIGYTETAEERKNVITTWCEAFINSRLQNNNLAEKLKAALLIRLLDNIENIDLELASRIYTDISDVSAVDFQNAMANVNGNAAGIPNNGGTSIIINNATAEGASVTNNTLNANPQQVTQLKEVATLNSSIKSWNNIPLPKKKHTNTDYSE